MKRIVSLMLVLVMGLCALTACGGSGGGGSDGGSNSDEAFSVDSLKTFGDIIALDAEEDQWAVYDDKVVYAFKVDDMYYRAIGAISEEDSQALFAIDFSDDDYEAQQEAILSPIAIDKVETLNDQILTQEERDALVGKTGKELMDAGWTFSGYNLEDMEFWMNYGPFMYSVFFDGEVAEEDYDNFDEERDTAELTVKKVDFNAMGDATNLE